MSDINFGEIEEALNNKVDLDFRNIDATKSDIVIEYQEPSELNNYTWYRLYASGWVEQGGQLGISTSASGTVTLPIQMLNPHYNVFIQTAFSGTQSVIYDNRTTTSFDYSGNVGKDSWYVCGKANMTGHEILPSLYPKHEEEAWEHRVISFQKPTEENNYTWYRLYADGWVEQGGLITNNNTYTLPVTMADANYYVNVCWDGGKSQNFYPNDYQVRNLTTTSFYTTASRNGSNVQGRCWEVKGMAATN